MKRLRPPIYLDTSVFHVAMALVNCVFPPDEDLRIGWEAMIAAKWDHDQHQVVGISERSVFLHYLMNVFQDPKRKRVVVSSVNHPHMFQLLEEMGFYVDPVPVMPETLCMDPAALEARLGPDVFAVMSADLLGGASHNVTLARIAHSHGALFWQDAAQGFLYTKDWGCPEADLVLWSLGPLKTNTAFGGGVARVKDYNLAYEIRRSIRDRPSQSTISYAKKVALIGALLPLQDPRVYYLFDQACERLGINAKSHLLQAIRSHTGANVFDSMLFRPSMALLAQMLAVSNEEAEARVDHRQRVGEGLLEAITARAGRLKVAGENQAISTHWMMGLRGSGAMMRDALRRAGVDAMLNVSALVDIAPGAGKPFQLLLPVFPDLTPEEETAIANAIGGSEVDDAGLRDVLLWMHVGLTSIFAYDKFKRAEALPMSRCDCEMCEEWRSRERVAERSVACRVTINYTNWRGERGARLILPRTIHFGSNQWHPDPQWLLTAYDIDKKDVRDFAMAGIHSWSIDGGTSADMITKLQTHNTHLLERARAAEEMLEMVARTTAIQSLPETADRIRELLNARGTGKVPEIKK
jgi:hypothetical protein